ncbi:polycystin-1-like protein 2 [Branchiostoma floridae x Branchiostoma japonicum]
MHIGIHNGIGAVLQNVMEEKGVSRTSSGVSWSSMLPTVLAHFEDATNTLTSLVLRSSLSDSPPVVFDLPIGTVLYQKLTAENIQQGEFATERPQGFVTLPDAATIFGTTSNESIVNSKFVAFNRNPMTWDPDTDPRSSVLSLDFYDETGHRLPVEDTAQPLEFHLQNYDKPGFPNVTFMNETTVADNGLTYHKMEVDNETTPTPVLVMLIPPPHVIAYQVYMQYNEPPTPDNHNFTATIPPLERACDVSIPELSGRDVTALFPWLLPEVNGTYYIGVKELGYRECRRVPGVSYADVKSKINNALDNETYSLAILTPQCVWWDKKGVGQWDPSGCTVGPKTTVNRTQCLTTHLTSFGSDFMVPPNSIDFSTVFAKFANLSDNAAVFSTVIVMFGIYFIIVFFLFKADKRDRIKWGVLPIADNDKSDENFYLLTVYTGMKAGSGTSSKAGIILHGADGDTGPRPLAASKNQVFKRGSISSFLLSTSAELGDLTHLHVWHDNSGAGGDSSWFLDKIVVGDLQSDKRYVFFCQRWLAVEMDDGRVDRFLSAAGRDELTNFSSIFQERTRHDMSDGHLWFSVASRPTRSHFTRVQRASCCLSLVFLTMITNAMFYRTDDSLRQQVYRLGPFVFTPSQLWISVVSTLIVFPVNFVIVYVFTKSRPNPGKTKQSSTGLFYQIPSSASKMPRNPVKQQNDKTRKQSGLPHWFVYIGWVLVFLSATGSAFFVILYSMEWGAEKSGEWLTSILLSIFQSVLIVQPLKVLLLGLLIAFMFKKLGKTEVMDAGALNDDEEFLPKPMDAKDVRPPAKPVSCRASDDRQLAAARALRLKEARMRTILWDVFKHFLVVAVVFYLAFSSSATVGHHMHKSLKQRFPTFKKVDSVDKLWSWSNTELLGVLFTLNGSKLLDDQSYRVGAAAFKQFRSRPGDCRTNITTFPRCKLDYTMTQHEEGDFAVGWRPLPKAVVNATRCRGDCSNGTAWTFTEGKSLPYSGQVKTYVDGAYMFEIGNDPEQAALVMERLQERGWLDGFTEAVVVEINAYNANADLFAVITLLVEFVAGRGTTPTLNIHIFKLSSYVGTSGQLMIGFQIAFVVLFTLSLFREGKKMFHQKKMYFCQPWNCLEFLRLLICVVAIVLFSVKEGLRSSYVSQLKALKGGYLSFRIIAAFSDVFASVLAILVFVMTLQFLQLLSFNRSIGVLFHTLRKATSKIAAFMSMLCVVFIAFSTSGGLLFGGEADGYINILTSARTLLVMMFGDTTFKDMSADHLVIFRIYFLSFVIVVVMVLASMFLGILDEQFATSKSNPDGPGGDSDMGEFMVDRALQYFGIGTRSVRPRAPEAKGTYEDEEASEDVRELESKLDLVLKKINSL